MNLSGRRVELARISRAALDGARSIAIDGRTVLSGPDAAGNYNGLYWRDYCYTLEGLGDLIPLDEIAQAVDYVLEPLTKRGAYPIFPKARTAQGFYTYNWRYPGPGHIYAADNPIFAVKVIYEYVKRGGAAELFAQYAGLLERFMRETELSENGLVEDKIGPAFYGFYDTVELTGEICFGSLLWIEAAGKLAELFRKIGEDDKATEWERISNQGRASLCRLWNDDEGMFISDTKSNRMIDVWASAYAVYIGAVDDDCTQRISRWFLENYDKCVHRGHVRHTPKPGYWKKVGPDAPPAGQYQNGGYWAVPSPWVVHTISLANKPLALSMQESLSESLVELNCPECINEDGTLKLPGYVASCAMGSLALTLFEEE